MSEIKCKCGQLFKEADFEKHFSRCEGFKNYFKEFDSKFGDLLKRFSEEKENLFIIRILLKQYVGVLERKIKTQ